MLYINDEIRIKKLDDKNTVIETYEEIKNPKTQEIRHDWVLYGYYQNLQSALQIGVLEILIDKKLEIDCYDITGLISAIKELKDSLNIEIKEDINVR